MNVGHGAGGDVYRGGGKHLIAHLESYRPCGIASADGVGDPTVMITQGSGNVGIGEGQRDGLRLLPGFPVGIRFDFGEVDAAEREMIEIQGVVGVVQDTDVDRV